jgi:hypothetical protein
MRRLRIILIAHDSEKANLVEWARFNAGTLSRHDLIATAATGEAIHEGLGLDVRVLLHGPAGGDAHAGALIATGAVATLFETLMFTLRCTAGLRERLVETEKIASAPPSTRLGDWYAHLLFTRPQLVLCVSDRTLLPVLVPARESRLLVPRLREAVAQMLGALGVAEGWSPRSRTR